MNKLIAILIMGIITFSVSEVWANSTPVVSNVIVSQRGDDSNLVDIYYNLADGDGDACTVWVSISDDGGTSWRVPVDNFSGAVGAGISPGTNKHIVWDAGADMPGKNGSFKVRVWADDGKGPDSMVPVPGGWFGYQNAAPENYIFVDSFAISKYETSVGQYCQFLNDADPTGSHWTSGQEIIRKGDAGNYYYEIQTGREHYPID
ncbi:MAG: formylglycine-generating enzyme family protein, partial [Planctomycetes bacterium]|nr:formylglycine-generating enzyme family protein [Planctomycetota bacterium]